MTFWKKLLDWLTAKPRRSHEINHPDLNPIDTDAIKREIRLEEVAEQLGRAGIPASDAMSLSGIEAKVVQLVDKARQGYVAWGRERLRVLNQDIIDLDITPLANKALEADTSFEHRADSLLSDLRVTLKALSDDVVALNTEFQSFRSTNHLAREPHYPSSAKKFFLVAVLVAFVVLEGVLNATFFAQGVAGGLAQGFVFAAVFSFVNIICGSGIGFVVVPNINHVKAWRKTFGFIGILAAIFLAVGIALLIAHFRDALSHRAGSPAVQALTNLSSHPFTLADINSWLLFGLSIVFALIAVLDGYSLDDPYPGYGKLARRLNLARDDYEAEMSEVRRELEDLKEEAIQELEKTADDIKTKLSRLNEAIQHKDSTGGRLNLAFSDAHNCAVALIKTFQNVNCLYRPTTAPVPAYFGETSKLAPLDVPSFATDFDREKYQKQVVLVDKVVDEKQRLIANIQASFNSKHDSLQALDAHFPSSSEQV